MNYLKKLQNIGFKKQERLVVVRYDRYSERKDGLKLISLKEFIQHHEKESTNY
jgi:hypothetical protein